MNPDLLTQWWPWTLAAIAFGVAEVALGTQLYLLAMSTACAAVAIVVALGFLDESWQGVLLLWTAMALAAGVACAKLGPKLHGSTEDPNRPLGRTKACEGYETAETKDEANGGTTQ